MLYPAPLELRKSPKALRVPCGGLVSFVGRVVGVGVVGAAEGVVREDGAAPGIAPR